MQQLQLVAYGEPSDVIELNRVPRTGSRPGGSSHLLLNRYVSLMPGHWIGQTAANTAMGQYITGAVVVSKTTIRSALDGVE